MLMNILPVSRRRAGLSNDGAVISKLRDFDLASIDAPTLLISLEDDGYGTLPGAQYTAGKIRNARFIGFPTGGHLWLGHDEEVSTLAREFLTVSADGQASAMSPLPYQKQIGVLEAIGN
jgi:pimeloyl-ACP methyl ester carboxylesterase